MSSTTDEHIVRTTDDILNVKDKHNEQKIGVLLVVITHLADWMENIIHFSQAAEFSEMKIVICTVFTDAKTHKKIKELRIDGTFAIYATENEIIELFIAINNNETRYLLPEAKHTATTILGKKNRTITGGYIMPEKLKTVIKHKYKRNTYQAIADKTGYKKKTMEGWVLKYRKESGTKNPKDDYNRAIENGWMEEIGRAHV